MTPSAAHRRALGWFNATRWVVVAIAMVAAACSEAAPSRAQTLTTVDPASIPLDHGLSQALVDHVIASTVAIAGVACGRTAFGSGFAVSEELVVTNAHVIVGMDPITVHSLDGEEQVATAVAFDAINDLALLQVEGAAFDPLPTAASTGDASSDSGSVGMLAAWDSAPFPDPVPYRINRPVTVRIEPVGGTEPVERPAYLLAADIESGDSGAALVNKEGEVAGVVFAASVEGPGVGYAVRASAIDDLLSHRLDPNLTIPNC